MTDSFLSRTLLQLLLFLTLASLSGNSSYSQSGFRELIDVNHLYPYFEARGMSADGKVIFGTFENANYYSTPILWDTLNGFQPLPFPPYSDARLYGITADGSTVVGYLDSSFGESRAFTLSRSGIQYLPAFGTNPGHEPASYGLAVSADGRIVAGWSTRDDDCSGDPTKWIDGTPNLLPPLSYVCGGWVYGISPNGEYVFGDEG